nr:hypothetical protein [[Eubacterium] cellulosolvens]
MRQKILTVRKFMYKSSLESRNGCVFTCKSVDAIETTKCMSV